MWQVLPYPMWIWLPQAWSNLYQQHPKLIHQWNIEMLSCEPSKMHNYYHQNMEVHLGIETGPSQYGVKDHTMVMKQTKVHPL